VAVGILQYLSPFLDELSIYSQSAVGKELIDLARLVDIVPASIEDKIIARFIPGSTLTLPMNLDFPLHIPVGHWKIPLPAHFTLINITLSDLDDFKTLHPARFLSGNFTWGGDLALRELPVTLRGKMVVLGKEVSFDATAQLAAPSLHFELIAAFNRTKLCEVWGSVMDSSPSCLLWPMMVQPEEDISGLNVTSLRVNVSDFTFNLTVSGLGSFLNDELGKQLTSIVNKNKANIIAMLPSLDARMAGVATSGILETLPKLQSQCHPSVLQPDTIVGGSQLDVLNVSRVCLSNNAAFVLKWSYFNCPSLFETDETPGFDVDQSKCMDVSSAMSTSSVEEGDPIRARAHAVAGIHKLVDPALRYVPNSNAASFECSGTTLAYHCDLVSVVPVDPNVLPRASKICVINHAGFVMEFSAENTRTGGQKATGRYPIDQTQCIEPVSVDGTREGDQFKMHVHAILGKRQDTTRDILYANNNLTATFECRGTTLDYSCKLLGA